MPSILERSALSFNLFQTVIRNYIYWIYIKIAFALAAPHKIEICAYFTPLMSNLYLYMLAAGHYLERVW